MKKPPFGVAKQRTPPVQALTIQDEEASQTAPDCVAQGGRFFALYFESFYVEQT